ncbi:unnamed protein product [Prunus armeniaca]|uniref:Bulb-type lectin domain-containing protein n=1 Tax=Prunus armeniaca TaxID=36596 RepID=A0A6J5UJJ1_PRUAR|nr:unnamed protein product [Prunus armeniaca]
MGSGGVGWGDKKSSYIWSSSASVPASAMNATSAELLDCGNLHQRDGEVTLWQSFDHPADTLLPDMRLSVNKKTVYQRRLTSWAALNDPQPRKFTLGFDPKVVPGQAFIWKENAPYWRSTILIGKETQASFGNLSGNSYFFAYNFDIDEVFLTYGVSVSVRSVKLRAKLNPTGQIVLQQWLDYNRTWLALWTEPVHKCDFYAHCSSYGACDKSEPFSSSSSPCKCLIGFRTN